VGLLIVPAISVIIPVYNRPALLATVLHSVLAQTHTDFEVIVVDDGSSEDLEAAVPALQAPTVRLIRQPKRGAGAARNTGLAQAAGEYVSFIDSDDVMLPWNLEALQAALEKAPQADIAHGWATTVDHAGAEAQWTRPELEGIVHRQYLYGNPNLMGTLLARRACFQGEMRFDPSLPMFEDWDLWLRLSFQARFTCVRRKVARIRFQAEQRTTSQPGRVVADTARRIYAKLEADPVAGPMVKPLRRRLHANAHVMAGHHFRLFGNDRPAARAEFVRAVQLDPAFGPAWKGLMEALVGRRPTQWLRALRSRWYASH
jgi:glycosyltransferase involved in cell wall biosynthesis